MKKLLLGALLVVTGAMSFGQIVETVTGSDSNGTATGVLPLEAKGEVIETSGKALLVITPLESASPDATALVFNHGKIAKGTVGSDLKGSYEAKVLVNETVVPGTYEVKLDGEGGTPSADEKSYSKTVNITGKDEAAGVLTYELLAKDGKTDIHEGVIISKFDATGVDSAGTFVDRSVNLEVTVSGVDMSGVAGA